MQVKFLKHALVGLEGFEPGDVAEISDHAGRRLVENKHAAPHFGPIPPKSIDPPSDELGTEPDQELEAAAAEPENRVTPRPKRTATKRGR